MRIPKFTVLTKKLTLLCEDKGALAEEQNKLFFELFPNKNESVIYHTFKSSFSDDEEDEGDISDFDFQIQSLVLKDGVDLVKFQNGNIGFVSYCNKAMDAFEIIRKER